MLQKVLVLLVSSALAFGGVGAASAAPGNAAKSGQTSEARGSQQNRKNTDPLPAGGAAGIQQAQGMGGNDWLLIGGSLLAAGLILVLVAGNSDDTAPGSSTH